MTLRFLKFDMWVCTIMGIVSIWVLTSFILFIIVYQRLKYVQQNNAYEFKNIGCKI